MRRIIRWKSQHLEVEPLTGKIVEPEYNEDDYDEDYFGNDENYVIQKIQTQNVMSTPFGLWRIDDSMNPYKHFKLWLADTNFSIIPQVVEIIEKIPGVEILQVISRYKFIIGVGELFDIRDVRVAIENSLACNREAEEVILDSKVLEQVEGLKQSLSTHNQWAIYVFPNGNIDFTTSDEVDFKSKVNLYKQAVDYSNGILIESQYE